jgi:C4-type Zn-finger protein
MRDNSKRISTPPVEPAPQQNSFLDFATPTELVDLPSQGEFYPVDHPLHGQETIEIKFMTARDEDILTSPSLLKKGVALDRLIQNVIVDKAIKVDSLLAGDKAAIMIASRINGFGEEYKTRMTCPSCDKPAETTFDLSEIEVYHGDDYGEYDVKPTGDGTFIIKTPKTGIDVEVRLLDSKDENMLVERLRKASEKKNAVNTGYMDQLSLIVVSVNGHSETEFRKIFVEHVTAFEARYIRSAYSRLSPGPNMRQNFKCPACSHEQEVEIPMSVDFFWLRE